MNSRHRAIGGRGGSCPVAKQDAIAIYPWAPPALPLLRSRSRIHVASIRREALAPSQSRQTMDEAIVVAKLAPVFWHESQSLVELVRTKVARKGINHNGDDVGIGKAKLERASHHRLAVPPAEIFGRPNPNVYGAHLARSGPNSASTRCRDR
jgi:hypothetical protein